MEDIHQFLPMATTTTTVTALERTAGTILADYELHHSRQEGRETQAPSTASTIPPSGPAREWDTTHRRVPSHRPINRDRDQSEVRVYLNNAERAFVSVMFAGLFFNAVSFEIALKSIVFRTLILFQTAAKIWRRTFGRLNDRIFRYNVGGEL